MFPIEIWEQILKNIDAEQLVKLRLVSTTWNSIITKHLQESDAWYRACKKAVPQEHWLRLLENTFYLPMLTYSQEAAISPENKLNYKIWMTLYRSWVKWCDVRRSKSDIVKCCEPIPKNGNREHITCLAVLGELFAVGSSEGFIRLFNMRSRKLVFRADQYELVKDIKLIIQGKNYDKTTLLATSVFGKTRAWDVTSQKNLFHVLGDTLCAGYGYYGIISMNNKLYICDAMTETNYQVELLMTNQGHEEEADRELSLRHERRDNNIKFVDMLINNDKLYFLTDNGLLCDLDITETKEDNKFLHTPNIQSIGVPKDQKIQNYYLLDPETVFCITDQGCLGISVGRSKWQLHNIFQSLEGIITSIFYHPQILVLGLDTGDICIYQIEKTKDLKRIDFKSYHKRIRVSKEPIVSIKMLEYLGDQRLLVATGSAVYYIKFYY